MKKTSYILLLSAVTMSLLTSCRSELGVNSTNEVQKLVLTASLCADSNVSVAQLSTSVIVGQENQDFEFPENAIISIRQIGTTNFETFEFESDDFYRQRSMEIIEGESYEISADLPNSDYLGVFGKTTVPTAEGIKSINLIERENISVDPTDVLQHKTQLTFELILEEPDVYPAYYHLIPSRKDLFITEEEPSWNKEFKSFSNYNFEIGENAMDELSHLEGILIDQSKLSNNTIVLTFETSDILKEGYHIFDEVFFTLRSVEEQYYRYHLATSQLAQSSPGSFGTSYSNINNGYGIFSSFAERRDSIDVK